MQHLLGWYQYTYNGSEDSSAQFSLWTKKYSKFEMAMKEYMS